MYFRQVEFLRKEDALEQYFIRTAIGIYLPPILKSQPSAARVKSTLGGSVAQACASSHAHAHKLSSQYDTTGIYQLQYEYEHACRMPFFRGNVCLLFIILHVRKKVRFCFVVSFQSTMYVRKVQCILNEDTITIEFVLLLTFIHRPSSSHSVRSARTNGCFSRSVAQVPACTRARAHKHIFSSQYDARYISTTSTNVCFFFPS